VKPGHSVARWGVVLLYVSVIYLTIPYTPRWWNAAQALTGASSNALALLPLATTGGVVLVAAAYRTRANILAWLALTALGAVYYYLYGHVFQQPIERLHLIEYALLSWIIWWAWRPSRQSLYRSAAGVWGLNAAVGATDEWIQHYTPGRFGEFRDVAINWESAALGLAVLLVTVAPWKPEGTAPDASSDSEG
jgi:VanZ family protein